MIKIYAALLRPLILSQVPGTLIDVPFCKLLLGSRFRIGYPNNTSYGKSLKLLADQGYLVFYGTSHSYGGTPTTLSLWQTTSIRTII